MGNVEGYDEANNVFIATVAGKPNVFFTANVARLGLATQPLSTTQTRSVTSRSSPPPHQANTTPIHTAPPTPHTY